MGMNSLKRGAPHSVSSTLDLRPAHAPVLGLLVLLTGMAINSHSVSAQEQSSDPTDTAVPAGKQYAIIIGVNGYHKSIGRLEYAVADATGLHEVLTAAPGGFLPEDTVLVADDQPDEYRPTRGNIYAALQRIKLAGPEDMILIYFAGHGVMHDNKLWLLPSDVTSSTIENMAVPYADIIGLLDDSPAKHKVVILDACHSGAGRDIGQMTGEVQNEIKTGSKGKVILYSCIADEKSYPWPEKGHGAFTYFLIEGLKGRADASDDGLISAKELGSYTYRKTHEWAIHSNYKQTPKEITDVTGEIILAKVPMNQDVENAGTNLIGAGTLESAKLYQMAAPSVLLLETESSFATGFVAGEPGLIVTCDHVASDARVDDFGRQFLLATVGTLNEETGFMQAAHKEIKAIVVKEDEALGLALLRVTPEAPGGDVVMNVPPLALRPIEEKLSQLEDVFLIGNAGAGFPWSIKEGNVQQVGRFGDTTDLLVKRQSASRENLDYSGESTKDELLVIESSVASASGDSGGPLLDSHGQVAGVCLLSVNFDDTPRYFYVHVNELREFIKEPPNQPLSVYNFPATMNLQSLSSLSGVQNWSLKAGADDNQVGANAVFWGYDSDGDACLIAVSKSVSESMRTLLEKKGDSPLPGELVDDFKPEFVWLSQYFDDIFRTFYDSDGKDGLDIMRIDRDYDAIPDVITTLNNGEEMIRQAPEGTTMLAPDALPSRADPEFYATLFPQIQARMDYLQNISLFPSMDLTSLFSLSKAQLWVLATSVGDNLNADNALLTGYDGNGDVCLIAVSRSVPEALRALLYSKGDDSLPTDLVDSFEPGFVWLSQQSESIFRTFYDTDGANGLDEMRIDRDYDGMPDFVFSLLREGEDRIVRAVEGTTLLSLDALPPESNREWYEDLFQKVSEKMYSLQNENPFDTLDLKSLYSLANAQAWTLVYGSHSTSAVLLCVDDDVDACLIAVSKSVSESLRAFLDTNGTDALPAELVDNFEPEFVWLSQYYDNMFRALYDTDGEDGLDVMRVDNDYDAIPDMITSLDDRIVTTVKAEDGATMLAPEDLPPGSNQEWYEDLFQLIKESMDYLRNL